MPTYPGGTYPTTPTLATTDPLNTAGTVAAAIAIYPNGAPIDLKNSIPGRGAKGLASNAGAPPFGTGRAPIRQTATIGAMTNVPILSCGSSSRGYVFQGSGSTASSPSNTRGMLYFVRPRAAPVGASYTGQLAIIAASNWDLFPWAGAGLYYKPDGTVRLGFFNHGSSIVDMSTTFAFSLTLNQWYGLWIAYDDTNPYVRYAYVWDVNGQVYLTGGAAAPRANATMYTDSAAMGPPGETYKRMTINCNVNQQSYPFVGDIALGPYYTYYLPTDTLAAGYFQTPASLISGPAYMSSSGTLTLPNSGTLTGTCALALDECTSTTITVTWAPPTGGSTPYTYAVHRSSTPAFTPSGATQIATGLSQTYYTDTPPAPTDTATNGIYYYKVVCTDSTSPTAQTVTYKQTSGALLAAPEYKAVAIGHSMFQNNNEQLARVVAHNLASRLYPNTIVQRGLGGAILTGTGGSSWSPGGNHKSSLAITGGVPTSGTIRLLFNGQFASNAGNLLIPFNCTASQMALFIAGASTVGAGNVVCTGGPWPGTPIVWRLQGALANQAFPAVVLNSNSFNNGATVTETVQVGGNPAGTLLAQTMPVVTAEATTTGAAVTDALVLLETNDTGQSATQIADDANNLNTYLLGQGITRIIWIPATTFPQGTNSGFLSITGNTINTSGANEYETRVATMYTFHQVLKSLTAANSPYLDATQTQADYTKIFLLDTLEYRMSAIDPEDCVDGTHRDTWASMPWANNIARSIESLIHPSGPPRSRFVNGV